MALQPAGRVVRVTVGHATGVIVGLTGALVVRVVATVVGVGVVLGKVVTVMTKLDDDDVEVVA